MNRLECEVYKQWWGTICSWVLVDHIDRLVGEQIGAVPEGDEAKDSKRSRSACMCV